MQEELLTAYRDLQSSDLEIDALTKKFGDDVDKRRAHQEAEGRRDHALQTLATVSAGSSEDMIAKAKAIQQGDVQYDSQFPAIAASLADDVIPVFQSRCLMRKGAGRAGAPI